MDKKFRTPRSQLLRGFTIHLHLGKQLPAIRHHPIMPIPFAATQVQDKMSLAHPVDERSETIPVQPAFPEYPRSHDDLRCTRIEPPTRVIQVYASANLKPSWP